MVLRKQAFHEVGQGKLGLEMQRLYEDCQQLALQSKQAITITLRLTIEAPPDGDRFGKTSFTLTHNQPTLKSVPFTTEYSAGVAVRDGESVEAILQTRMDLRLPGERAAEEAING